MRAVANIPMSVLVFVIAMPFAWSVNQPNWAVVKALFVGPFLALAATPFFLAIHLLAACAGFVGGQVGLPGRVCAAAAAALLGYLFSRGSTDPAFGDPTVSMLAFTAAVVLPWFFGRPLFWPQRFAI